LADTGLDDAGDMVKSSVDTAADRTRGVRAKMRGRGLNILTVGRDRANQEEKNLGDLQDDCGLKEKLQHIKSMAVNQICTIFELIKDMAF